MNSGTVATDTFFESQRADSQTVLLTIDRTIYVNSDTVAIKKISLN